MLSALLVAVLLTVPLASGVIANPSSIDTLSSSDLYFTVHNPTQSYLINVTVILPPSLTPVGLDTNLSRSSDFVTAGRDSYRAEWLLALASEGTILLGMAVNPSGGPKVLNLAIQETFDDGSHSNSTLAVNLVCPCLLGVDVRYLAYVAVGLVLLLPVFEVVLHRTKPQQRANG